jgi:hypothetical protein
MPTNRPQSQLDVALANAGEASSPRREDRRQNCTPRLSRYSFGGGRRKSVRRDEEREGAFVDLYSAQTLVIIAWVALMNGLDSFFTILHLQAGGIELNPVAAELLQSGRFGFVLGKAIMITMALLVLALHKNFYLARMGLIVAMATYTALVGYHLWLL